MENSYFVYILTTRKNTVLYTGITSDIMRRVWEHREGIVKGFTQKYNVKKLVYYEVFDDVNEAIHREKCIKRWKRDWKIELINKMNSEWNDLYEEQNDQIPAFAGMTGRGRD